MNTQYRRTRKTYLNRLKSDITCPFCDRTRLQEPVYENDLVYVIINRTPYDLWELHDVEDHRLVVPKRHVTSIDDMTDEERLAILKVVAEYEKKGYNTYLRGVGFMRRSVGHQHTHLIKACNKEPRFSVFLKKPYLLIKH